MKDCDICQTPRHYSELIRLNAGWYCIRCIAAAIEVFSHENNEQPAPVPQVKQSRALTTLDQWPQSQTGKSQP